MTQDFSGAYVDPGLYIEEITGPVITAIGVAPTIIGLVGDTQRYQTFSETVQLSGTTSVLLSKLGISTASVVVTDRYTGITYSLTTDYTLTAGAGADAALGTQDDTLTIQRSGASTIPTGTFVTVTYRYTDPNFYALTHFTDYDDVRDKYGDPFNSAGALNSPLTLAAYLAFTNGATELYAAAVQAAAPTPTTNEWSTTIDKLREEQRINVVVPVSGSATIHGLVNAHENLMFNLGQFRRGFVGYDVGNTPTTIKTAALGYGSTRMVVVGPSDFQFFNGVTNSVIDLGGQYAAAATAGVHASQDAAIPITRKQVRGFVGIPAQLTEANMLDMQRNGVSWLWQRRNTTIVVRHGLTTNMSNIYTREISIQAAKDRLQVLVLDTLDAQQLIGSVITDETPGLIMAAVVGALETSKATRLIYDYSGVKWRQPNSNPTMVQVRFMYKPSLPLNYIQVQFAIDTNTGTSTFTDIG